MRFISSLKNDIRFQIKYGFYFLYALISVVYIIALMITPTQYKNIAASLIILTDPAMLGIFFIGGIWLLEKGEGLHSFWSISPLRPVEYIVSKSISLAIVSTLSADLIVLATIGNAVHFISLSFSVFTGAVVFNLIGLIIASYARTVNHYMIIVVLPAGLLSLPPVMTAFGLALPLLEIFPGTALWHMIISSIDLSGNISGCKGFILILWLGMLLFMAGRRIETALRSEGGTDV